MGGATALPRGVIALSGTAAATASNTSPATARTDCERSSELHGAADLPQQPAGGLRPHVVALVGEPHPRMVGDPMSEQVSAREEWEAQHCHHYQYGTPRVTCGCASCLDDLADNEGNHDES